MRVNDVDLHVEVDGSAQGDRPPLVLLHGFTGSTRAWDMVRPALARRRTVISVDALGHGLSEAPADPRRYGLDWVVRDVLAVLDALGLPRVDLLGYSMGGRMALHLAVHQPARVARLILESASPGIEDAAERQQRSSADELLAQRIERDGLAAFVAEWEGLPLLALAPDVSETVRQAQHTQRLSNTTTGLANSLRGLSSGRQTPLWDRLADLRLPVTLIVGQRDARYTDLGARMHGQLPRSTLHVVADAGHTVHLDQAGQFTALLETALDNKLTHRAGRC
jgi:2-succinyl-6-hydroxy-2,4-cyclohexadiene-1-carboxylate synthase